MNVIIKEVTGSTQKSAIAEEIIRSLPDWFELEDGIVEYINGVKTKTSSSLLIKMSLLAL
jgi:hypothetical protein